MSYLVGTQIVGFLTHRLVYFRSKGGSGPLALPSSVLSLKNPCGYSGTSGQKEIKPPEPDDSLIVKV